MNVLKFRHFLKKYSLKDNTMNESEIKRVYMYNINPRVSKKYSNKGVVNIHLGSQGGTHWFLFYSKR